MAGKGDRYRKVNEEQYRKNYDAVFGTCQTHPEYRAQHEPTADCIVCRRLWREAQLKECNGTTTKADPPPSIPRGDSEKLGKFNPKTTDYQGIAARMGFHD